MIGVNPTGGVPACQLPPASPAYGPTLLHPTATQPSAGGCASIVPHPSLQVGGALVQPARYGYVNTPATASALSAQWSHTQPMLAPPHMQLGGGALTVTPAAAAPVLTNPTLAAPFAMCSPPAPAAYHNYPLSHPAPCGAYAPHAALPYGAEAVPGISPLFPAAIAPANLPPLSALPPPAAAYPLANTAPLGQLYASAASPLPHSGAPSFAPPNFAPPGPLPTTAAPRQVVAVPVRAAGGAPPPSIGAAALPGAPHPSAAPSQHTSRAPSACGTPGSTHPSPAHPSPLDSQISAPHAPHAPSMAVPSGLMHDESLNGSDSDYVLVSAAGSPAPVRTAPPPTVAALPAGAPPLLASTAAAAADALVGAPSHEPAEAAVEAAEAAYMHGLLELANLLARGGAIADLAHLSADGMAHGEPLSPVESLALHVKALDLMSRGISLAEQVAAAADTMPPRLAPAVSEAISQAEALRARGSGLLRSAEGVRSTLASQQDHHHGRSSLRSSIGGGANAAADAGLGASAGGAFVVADDGADAGAAAIIGGGAARAACALGGVSSRGPDERTSAERAVDPMSVCVEEVLYRQALCMGREAAVDELLGHYESSATLYVRAKLTLEQLATEPMVGDADRAVLQKYGAGFAWRLAALRQCKQASPGNSAAGLGSTMQRTQPPTPTPSLDTRIVEGRDSVADVDGA